jgi:DNA polymerase-1
VRRERLEGEGYVITPLGRRLPCDSGRVYALTNYMIQSTAADCFKQGLIRLDAAGYSDWMILPVHDEIVLDVPVEHVKQTLHEVPEILSDKSMGVPITADADGPWTNWGAKYS